MPWLIWTDTQTSEQRAGVKAPQASHSRALNFSSHLNHSDPLKSAHMQPQAPSHRDPKWAVGEKSFCNSTVGIGAGMYHCLLGMPALYHKIWMNKEKMSSYFQDIARHPVKSF